MTPRERLESALAHRQPDRIPVDLGATPVTGMHISVVAGLREALGLDRHPVKVSEPYQMLGEIEPDLADALGLDAIGVAPPLTMFGFPNRDWKPWRAPWGQEVLIAGGFATSAGADGSLLIHPGGDLAAPPSGRLPAGGYFCDALERSAAATGDPAENCAEFQPLSAADLAHFRREVTAAHATGRAVVANFGGTALGDIALVPAPFLREVRGIRGVQDWYMATAERPEYVAEVFRRQVSIALGNLSRLHQEVGDLVTAVYLCGADFGTQRGPLCSPRSFAALWLPFYRELTGWIHTRTRWRVFKHSCGGIRPFLDHFVDAGIDIINPVQCSAAGMDPAELKRGWGDRLTFWGGGVDTQDVLPFGTPGQVRTQVRSRMELLGTGSGFVFTPVHNVQARTPVANVVAMFDELRRG